jgi:hypothetical protein
MRLAATVRSRTPRRRKRTPAYAGADNAPVLSLRRFNHLRRQTGLARQMPLHKAGISSKIAGFPILKLGWSGVHMFDGKNNRLLDSFSFRLALTAAVFAVWSGAGYVLLYLA